MGKAELRGPGHTLGLAGVAASAEKPAPMLWAGPSVGRKRPDRSPQDLESLGHQGMRHWVIPGRLVVRARPLAPLGVGMHFS